MNPEKENQYREEAERLAKLPRKDQLAAIAHQRLIAGEFRVPKAYRDAARERVQHLVRLLRQMNRKKDRA
jgi:hypothetical protein